MKFSLASLAFTIGFVVQVLANPTPQVDIVYHCGGEIGAVCPPNYRCCGPLNVVTGGTCYKGRTGVCPL